MTRADAPAVPWHDARRRAPRLVTAPRARALRERIGQKMSDRGLTDFTGPRKADRESPWKGLLWPHTAAQPSVQLPNHRASRPKG